MMVSLGCCKPFTIAMMLVAVSFGAASAVAQQSLDDRAAPDGQAPGTSSPKEEALSPIAIAFVQKLARGDFASAVSQFDETMTKALPADRLEAVWKNITRSVGAYQQSTGTHYESGDVYDILFVTCKFELASLDVKVVFDKEARVTGLFFLPATHRAAYRPPSYVDEAAYREIEVTFGSEPWLMAGTLSLPKDASPSAAVILVHGSGPNDRDETVGANRPFKDLAGGLASKGVVVLRYDKRTKTYGKSLPKDVTVQEETIDDVVAAAQWLESRPEVDRRRVFVLGHSLGGYLVPKIAEADSSRRIAGFVIMAGNARPLEDLVIQQTQYLLGLDGQISEEEQQSIDAIRTQVAQVKAIESQPDSLSFFGASAAYWRALAGYLPDQEAKLVTRPMFILQGERDYQVTMEDFARWKSALADRSDVRFKSYPALNHLMMAGAGPSAPAEYDVAGHVSAEVIEDLVRWIADPKGDSSATD